MSAVKKYFLSSVLGAASILTFGAGMYKLNEASNKRQLYAQELLNNAVEVYDKNQLAERVALAFEESVNKFSSMDGWLLLLTSNIFAGISLESLIRKYGKKD